VLQDLVPDLEHLHKLGRGHGCELQLAKLPRQVHLAQLDALGGHAVAGKEEHEPSQLVVGRLQYPGQHEEDGMPLRLHDREHAPAHRQQVLAFEQRELSKDRLVVALHDAELARDPLVLIHHSSTNFFFLFSFFI